MRKTLLTTFAAILATAGATSAMAYSSNYGNPALFGTVESPAATSAVDAGYPRRLHSQFGDLSLYGPVEAGSGEIVSVPVGTAAGFTRDFGTPANVLIPMDPAGTSGLRLR